MSRKLTSELEIEQQSEEHDVGWNFPSNNGGTLDGANDGAIDTFAGDRLSSLVREVVQNSLDATKDKSIPVHLHFSIDAVSPDKFSGFHDIIKPLKGCTQMAAVQNKQDKVAFYKKAIFELEKSEKIPMLCVHDKNTTGLMGTTDDLSGDYEAVSRSQWIALVKGAGLSQGKTGASLGSFGHGSKASFAMSGLRMVFYYTKIPSENTVNGFEERFQGKCILQSHRHPNGKGFTVGTGYYGKKATNRPLIDEDLLESARWAKALREKYSKDIGTSILIPFPFEIERKKFKLIIATRLLANFFYAIKNNKLIVNIQGTEINSNNLNEQFEECQNKIVKNSDDSELKDCFETIKTIIKPTHQGEQQITNFGRIEWYMRINELCEKAVGLARSSGMLITRKPKKLERFPSLRAFDFFVCVSGEEGSELLRKLENPQHNNFEFDRIDDPDIRKTTEKHYKIFTDRVREIITLRASIKSQEQVPVTDLADIFGDFSDAGSGKDNPERGKKLLLRKGSPPRAFPRTPPGTGRAATEVGGGGSGIKGGDGTGGGTGGSNPDPAGISDKHLQPDDDGLKRTGSSLKVQNFRFNIDENNLRKATVFFTCPQSGKFDFQISKIGEQGHRDIKISIKGVMKKSIRIDGDDGERISRSLEFSENIDQSVLEGKLFELEEVAI